MSAFNVTRRNGTPLEHIESPKADIDVAAVAVSTGRHVDESQVRNLRICGAGATPAVESRALPVYNTRRVDLRATQGGLEMRRCEVSDCARPIPEGATLCPRHAQQERRRRRRKSHDQGEVDQGKQTRIDWSGSPREQLRHWRNSHSAPPNLLNPKSKSRRTE